MKTAEIDRETPGSDARQRVTAALGRAAVQQDRVIEALQQWLAALSQSDQSGRLQRDLDRLRRDQEALNGRTRAVGRRTLTLDPADVPPGDAAELAAAANRQLELADRLDRLLEAMGSFNEELLDQARRLAVGDQMRRTAEEIRQNQLGHASGGQKQIAAALRTIAEMLARAGRRNGRFTALRFDAIGQLAAPRRQPFAAIPGCRPRRRAGRQSGDGRHAGVTGRPAGPAAPKEDIRSLLSRFGVNCRRTSGGTPSNGPSRTFRPNTRP